MRSGLKKKPDSQTSPGSMADSAGEQRHTHSRTQIQFCLITGHHPPPIFLFSLQHFLYLVKRTKSTIWLLILELPTVDYVMKLDIKYDLQIKVSEAQTFAVSTFVKQA